MGLARGMNTLLSAFRYYQSIGILMCFPGRERILSHKVLPHSQIMYLAYNSAGEVVCMFTPR